VPQSVKWLHKPQDHDYQAAEDYLSLIMSPAKAADCRQTLAAAQDDITHRKAKDILRASSLDLLDEKNKHVASDLLTVSSGQALSRSCCCAPMGSSPTQMPVTS
jgi:hypothetical protein